MTERTKRAALSFLGGALGASLGIKGGAIWAAALAGICVFLVHAIYDAIEDHNDGAFS